MAISWSEIHISLKAGILFWGPLCDFKSPYDNFEKS